MVIYSLANYFVSTTQRLPKLAKTLIRQIIAAEWIREKEKKKVYNSFFL